MKKIRLVLALAFALTSFAPLPAQADVCPGLKRTLKPMGYQQLAVSSSAVGFTLPTTGVVRLAVVMVEDNPIRYRDDGTNPTSSVGTLVQQDNGIIVCGVAVASFKAIRTGSDANLSINFYGD